MSRERPLLTIAIPTYNNFDLLSACLRSLTFYTEFPYTIIVVNNGPAVDADGVVFEKTLRSMVPCGSIRVIQAETNLGWQGGINLAFREAEDTPYFCMANDDLVFLPQSLGFWHQLIGLFRDPSVGAAGPITDYVMGSQNIHNFIHSIYETTLLIGFCLIVRSNVFAEIGGLDEGLPGGDDLDLSILIRKTGRKLLVNRFAFVKHIGAQTGPRVNSRWNQKDFTDNVNNALIRKHGVRAWYECIQSAVSVYDAVSLHDDSEGDTIRNWAEGLGCGLDLGCGGNKTVTDSIGVDLIEKGLKGNAGAMKWLQSAADVNADVRALPYENESQDYLIARHILEHMLDPLEVLREWKRVLKPGGYLLIALPNEDATSTMLIDYTHLHAYNPESARRLIETAGFNVGDLSVMRLGMSFCLKARKPAEHELYLREPVQVPSVWRIAGEC